MRSLVVNDEGRATPVGDAELDAVTARVAAGLAERGVGRGDVVAVQLPKGVLWLAVLRALWQLGAVSLPCPELLSQTEVADRVERSGAMLALLAEDDVPQADGTLPRHQGSPEDPAFLLFTSGTEGGPKGALHRRSYVEANRLQSERWMGVRAGDRVWCTAATGWSKSLRNVWMAAELCGAEAVLHRGRFDPDQRLALIAELRPDVLCMSPTEYRRCASAASFGDRPLAVREAVAAGETLDAPTVERWREAYGIVVRDGYGQTETGAVTGVLAGDEAGAGAMGRPLPGVDVRVDDGELCVVSSTLPTFFAGYWNDPRATAAALRDGLWHTGDLVRREVDGSLHYEGRRDDVISSSGYRIGPGEVEAALRSHPAVAEAAAVGLPDPERGQIVHADVVLAHGVAGSDELADALRDHVRGATAAYKYPRSIRFVAALPHTPTGKLQRSEVRRSLAAAGGSAEPSD